MHRGSSVTSWTSGGNITDAVRRYVAAVKDGQFPDDALHGF
jgi:3-methyl-2-oxobutanoate hydroxymethyltransferase